MKYIYYHVKSILIKNYKISALIILCNIFYCYYLNYLDISIYVENKLGQSFGLFLGNDLINVLMFIVINCFSIYIIVSSFYYQFKGEVPNLLLRISKKKYFFYKLLTIIFTLIVYEILFNFVNVIICSDKVFSITLFMLSFLKVLSLGLITLCTDFQFRLSKYKLILIFLGLFIVTIICTNIIWYILTTILSTIIFLNYNGLIISIYERN